jgi:hypothetical protein
MSVLARPQGLPERVWSLVGGLSAIGGRAERSVFEALINPGFVKDGLFIQTKADLARDTLGAASSLGLVAYDKAEGKLLHEQGFGSADALADHVHDRLCALGNDDTNKVLLEAYAWIAAESDRSGDLGWIYDLDRKVFADRANEALVGEDEDGKPMNEFKAVAWRRWLGFLGLGVSLPLANVPDFPSPAGRIARELRRAGIKSGTEMSGQDFLKLLSDRMPYLDGGRLYLQACERIGHVPRSRFLSPLLSAALRDLHDEGLLVLRPRGDATDALTLTDDSSHAIQTFNLVIIVSGAQA